MTGLRDMEYSCAKVALALRLRESAEHGGPRQQFGQDLDQAGWLRRINEIGRHSTAANGGELSSDLRVISRPVGPQQNIVFGFEFPLHRSVMKHRSLIDLAGKAPCCSKVDENRMTLGLRLFHSSHRKSLPLQAVHAWGSKRNSQRSRDDPQRSNHSDPLRGPASEYPSGNRKQNKSDQQPRNVIRAVTGAGAVKAAIDPH